MKRISSLFIIILLLLSSCQIDDGITPEISTSANITGGSVTEFFADITDIASESQAVTNGADNPSETVVPSVSVSGATQTATQADPTVPSTQKPTVPVTQKPTVPPTQKPTIPVTQAPSATASEMRAIWISCYDYTSAAGKTKAQYKAITDGMFRTIKNNGFNTAFVHLRANSDAFYKSDIFPYSKFIAGEEGASLPFDPFAVLLESAKANGISVHGWINPFRVSTQNDVSALSANNPAKKILDSGNADGRVRVLSNGIYYNPACTENHKLILDGVREIIGKYDIDGIHIDDYFYPTTEASFDKAQYDAYKSAGGTLSLSKWRISNVNGFVLSLYTTVKTADSSLIVSISPSGQIDKTLNEAYADCRHWLSQKGYADIIIPQIYFGFNHQTEGFSKLLNQWASLPRHSSVKLVCGIAAYKCAKSDAYAGTGKNEWTQSADILARQTKAIRSNKNYSGIAVFSYSDLNRSACKTEIENMKKEFTS